MGKAGPAAAEVLFEAEGGVGVGTIEQIMWAIERLSDEELAQLSAWVAALDAVRWDAQLESDVAAGRLRRLGAQAVQDFRQHRCTDL